MTPAATVLLLAVAAVGAFAQTTQPERTAQTAPKTPALFADADLPLGEQLIAEHACTACHQQRFGGDGMSIYRPAGRINTPGALRGMVDYCSTELNLGLFPEEVTAVAAVLQRDHYRFSASMSVPAERKRP